MADATGALRHDMVQKMDIAVEKLAEVPGRFVQPVIFEELAHEADIRAPGKPHFFGAVMQVEFRGERSGKRRRARATGVDERAINVEQNQFYHARKISKHRLPARFYGVFRGNNCMTTVFSGSFQLRKSGLHEKLESDLED